MDARILVVEDDLTVAEVVVDYLRHAGLETRLAVDGHTGLEIAATWQPDLIVLDLMLPGVSGLEVCRRLREGGDARTPLPVIMLTALSEESDRVLGLENGADDYVTKPFSTEELLARVRARLRERTPQGNVIEYRDVVMDRDRHEVHRGEKPIALTAKEYALLEYLLLHRNKVHTRDELFNGVWGSDFLGDSNLIDVYIRYLRGKIDDGFDDKLITTVRGVGYTIKD